MYLVPRAGCGKMWVTKGLSSTALEAFLAAVHMASLLYWLLSLPIAFLCRQSMFLASPVSWVFSSLCLHYHNFTWCSQRYISWLLRHSFEISDSTTIFWMPNNAAALPGWYQGLLQTREVSSLPRTIAVETWVPRWLNFGKYIPSMTLNEQGTLGLSSWSSFSNEFTILLSDLEIGEICTFPYLSSSNLSHCPDEKYLTAH